MFTLRVVYEKMPILDTTLRRLNRYLGFDITLEELEEILFTIGFELDSAKRTGDDYELKIEITPDRADCLSSVGLARAIRLYLGKENPKNYVVNEPISSNHKIIVDESVLPIRPYIAGVVVRNIKLSEEDLLELIWTQEKLHATFCRDRKKASIGFYPLNKISWPLRYYAEDPKKIKFRPLEFDTQLTGEEILQRHPTGKKYSWILANADKYPLFVDAEGHVLSMPPIINSADYGQITIEDTDILVETTGTHKETMLKTLNILSTILADLGGELYSVEIVYPENKVERTPDFKEQKWFLRLVDAERVLGIKLSSRKVVSFLQRMGYTVRVSNKKLLEVNVPPYRTDVFHIIDVIDDIARALGFDNFEPELTPVFTTGASLADRDLEQFVRDILIGLGFAEAFTFALTSIEDQFTKMRLEVPNKKVVKISGAKEAKLNIVRYWLLPELLKMLAENKAAEYPIKLYEVSDVARVCEKLSAGACNYRRLAILIADTNANYTQLKSTIEYLFGTMGIDISIKRTKHPSFIEGRVAKIIYNEEEIGVLGEIHPEVLMSFGLAIPVVAAELDLMSILGLEVKEVEWA